jgi:hypothetical protein
LPEDIVIKDASQATEDGLRDKKWIWYPKLRRAMAAFEDWNCAELIG